jgi:glycosyltransferase involved in cell wall biosynthesis
MSDTPDVTVVMSVYNGAKDLRDSMDSILSQGGVNLELIVVNDGSSDNSASILEEYAGSDERVEVIRQQNQGLTRALIVGCAAARGKYIARQDAGDISLPGRLMKQLDCIRQNPDSAFVSCGTRYVGPKGEHLYDVNQDTGEATTHLLALNPDEVIGPSHHGSTLFSRSLYERVEGYRSAFYFAQDLDLWIRLAEHGRHVVFPEILYEASVTVESISGLHRKEQVALTTIMLEGARLRRKGLSEQQILNQAESIKPFVSQPKSRLVRARAFYFIGSCLRRRNNPQAAYYFRQALKSYPLHLKSAVRLLAGWTESQ